MRNSDELENDDRNLTDRKKITWKNIICKKKLELDTENEDTKKTKATKEIAHIKTINTKKYIHITQ